MKVGKCDEPYGVETALGWSIVGLTIGSEEDVEDEHVSHRVVPKVLPYELCINDKHDVAFVHRTKTRESPAVSCPSEVIRILEADFQDKQQDKMLSQDDIKFLDIMEGNIHQNNDGFYQMPLPFKNGQPNLPDNLPMAIKRMEQLKKKMKANPTYAADYRKFMDK